MKCLNHQNILKKLIEENSIKNEESFLHQLDMNNLQKEASSFIDYLFLYWCTHLLTNRSKKVQNSNLLTRSEFIKEIIYISEIVIKEDSIKEFKIAVKVLLEDKIIEPLCKKVQKYKLSHLKFNDVAHSMEQDLKTGFLFAFFHLKSGKLA